MEKRNADVSNAGQIHNRTHFSPRPVGVAVVLPGPVLLHEVDVLQGDVVEVGERHDGRRGDAVGCV